MKLLKYDALSHTFIQELNQMSHGWVLSLCAVSTENQHQTQCSYQPFWAHNQHHQMTPLRIKAFSAAPGTEANAKVKHLARERVEVFIPLYRENALHHALMLPCVNCA